MVLCHGLCSLCRWAAFKECVMHDVMYDVGRSSLLFIVLPLSELAIIVNPGFRSWFNGCFWFP